MDLLTHIAVIAEAAAVEAQQLSDEMPEMTPEAFQAAALEHVETTYRRLIAIAPETAELLN